MSLWWRHWWHVVLPLWLLRSGNYDQSIVNCPLQPLTTPLWPVRLAWLESRVFHPQIWIADLAQRPWLLGSPTLPPPGKVNIQTAPHIHPPPLEMGQFCTLLIWPSELMGCLVCPLIRPWRRGGFIHQTQRLMVLWSLLTLRTRRSTGMPPPTSWLCLSSLVSLTS